jgi:hypothetical protein
MFAHQYKLFKMLPNKSITITNNFILMLILWTKFLGPYQSIIK